jgi:hypothetical protein
VKLISESLRYDQSTGLVDGSLHGKMVFYMIYLIKTRLQSAAAESEFGPGLRPAAYALRNSMIPHTSEPA